MTAPRSVKNSHSSRTPGGGVGVAHPLHRVHDPPGMGDQLVGRPGLGTEVPPAVRVLLVGRDPLDPVVVADGYFDPAPRDADPAERGHGPRQRIPPSIEPSGAAA